MRHNLAERGIGQTYFCTGSKWRIQLIFSQSEVCDGQVRLPVDAGFQRVGGRFQVASVAIGEDERQHPQFVLNMLCINRSSAVAVGAKIKALEEELPRGFYHFGVLLILLV